MARHAETLRILWIYLRHGGPSNSLGSQNTGYTLDLDSGKFQTCLAFLDCQGLALSADVETWGVVLGLRGLIYNSEL